MSKIAIKLGPSERKKHFDTKVAIVNFLDAEKNFWDAFFEERKVSSGNFISVVNSIRRAVQDSFVPSNRHVASISEDMSNAEGFGNALEKLFINKQILYSHASYTKFLLKETDPIMQIFMVGAYLQAGFDGVMYHDGGQLQRFSGHDLHKIQSLMSEAIAKKVLFERGVIDNVDAEREVLSVIKDEWGSVIFDAESKIKIVQDEFEIEKNDISEFKRNIDQKFTDTSSKFESFMETSKQNMIAFEDFYEKKLAMQSAVKYWRDKKHISYQVAALLAVVILFSGYFGVSYLFTISETIGHNLIETNTTLDNTKSAIKYMPLLHFAILSTFIIWFLRIIVKIFLSKLHGAEVASEREMFIKSYLALMNEHAGSIVDDSDRQLILQSIFRPASDGFISEDGPKMTDIITLMGKNRGQG